MTMLLCLSPVITELCLAVGGSESIFPEIWCNLSDVATNNLLCQEVGLEIIFLSE